MKKQPSDRKRLKEFYTAALPAAGKIPPVCRHFRVCGGCQFQNVPYPDQLKIKRDALLFIGETVARECQERPEDRELADKLREAMAGVEPKINPSQRTYAYRQRMDYVFAFESAGLRRAGWHRDVLELEECPLLGELGFRLFDLARRQVREAGIPCYNYLTFQGDLRYFVIRRTRKDDFLLSLVTRSKENGPAVMGVLENLFKTGKIRSGHWLLNDSRSDSSFGSSLFRVGDECLAEQFLDDVWLPIGPNSFCQANPEVAERAYSEITSFLARPGELVFDLYSGVAAIAQVLARQGARVVALENLPENVRLAHLGLEWNHLAEQVELVESDAASWLAGPFLTENRERPKGLVVNPPRPGVERSGLEAILKLHPERLAYLSCNPFTLFRDLTSLITRYRLVSLSLFDMFPQTQHFETLALLERL
ncbi:MAG: hypothetical protein LBU79_04505 [Planctomycetota bacterium]|nr:hypothetical protein [Planctomycetota bacterium]